MALRFTLLDRPAIRRLAAGGKIIEHGITAERLADGNVRWSVNVMVDGVRIHRVIGKESDRITRTTCEEFIERAKSDARAGRLSLPKGRKLALTMADAADDYVKRLEEGAGKNIVRKSRQLRLYLKPFFGSMRLDAISSFTVDRYKKKRLGADAANGTINRELATLSHLFSSALEWKWIDRLPCRPKARAGLSPSPMRNVMRSCGPRSRAPTRTAGSSSPSGSIRRCATARSSPHASTS